MSNYNIETEIIKRIYITDQGFEWFYEVCDNPEFPDEAFLIKQSEEGEIINQISIPKQAFYKLIESMREDYDE